jgi:2-methylisocitrate lyase-like PEP mutase family enzyme
MQMPSVESKYRAFLALHEKAGAFVVANAWDAGTSRILTALGYEALATTSAGFAFAIGRRDSTASLSREDVLQNAQAIVEATHLPVTADLEDGFGAGPDECALTIVQASDMGLVGGSIEDATGDAAAPIFDFSLAV